MILTAAHYHNMILAAVTINICIAILISLNSLEKSDSGIYIILHSVPSRRRDMGYGHLEGGAYTCAAALKTPDPVPPSRATSDTEKCISMQRMNVITASRARAGKHSVTCECADVIKNVAYLRWS